MNGTVESITTDWRGSMLTAAVASGDSVLTVWDTADFDEDGGWLTIADAAPIGYTTVDHDAATITLTGTAGAAYASGDPLVVWDPTVPGGAKVVEYVASVMTDGGEVPSVVPHAVVPLAGVDRLVGASVTLDQEDEGDWYVAQVLGREASIDPGHIGSPLFQAYLPVDGGRAGGATIAGDAAYHSVNDWSVATAYDPNEFVFDDTTGELTLRIPGSYLGPVILRWNANSSGRREVRVVSIVAGVETEEAVIRSAPLSTGSTSQTVPLLVQTTEPDTILRVDVLQDTGAGLSLLGDATGKKTQWRVIRVR